jgi:7-cyano-7-deazaguanine synthase
MATGSALDMAPSPEWWPFRNQLLVTLGAAWALRAGMDEVVVGAVAGDRSRHRDGTPWFYAQVDALLAGQEGSLRVRAPALDLSTEDLVARVDTARGMLGVTHSCHVSDIPCGECPGCIKRAEVMLSLDSSNA